MRITASFTKSIDNAHAKGTVKSSKSDTGHLHMKDAKNILSEVKNLSNTNTLRSLSSTDRLDMREAKDTHSKLAALLKGVQGRESKGQGKKEAIVKEAINILEKITVSKQNAPVHDNSKQMKLDANKASEMKNNAINNKLSNLAQPAKESRRQEFMG